MLYVCSMHHSKFYFSLINAVETSQVLLFLLPSQSERKIYIKMLLFLWKFSFCFALKPPCQQRLTYSLGRWKRMQVCVYLCKRFLIKTLDLFFFSLHHPLSPFLSNISSGSISKYLSSLPKVPKIMHIHQLPPDSLTLQPESESDK